MLERDARWRPNRPGGLEAPQRPLAAVASRWRFHRRFDEADARAGTIRRLDRAPQSRDRQQAGGFRVCEDCCVSSETKPQLWEFTRISQRLSADAKMHGHS